MWMGLIDMDGDDLGYLGLKYLPLRIQQSWSGTFFRVVGIN
jgi:hypothetical protein